MQMDNDGDEVSAEINVTPMVDLFMVLLLMFMILCTASVVGLKVNLPKAGASTSLAKPGTKAITVNNEGKIFLDTVQVTLPELEQQLTQQKSVTPEFPVVVRGDRQTQYQGIMDVLDLLVRLNITQVNLATSAPGK